MIIHARKTVNVKIDSNYCFIYNEYKVYYIKLTIIRGLSSVLDNCLPAGTT